MCLRLASCADTALSFELGAHVRSKVALGTVVVANVGGMDVMED
jgi:hypothetical protein